MVASVIQRGKHRARSNNANTHRSREKTEREQSTKTVGDEAPTNAERKTNRKQIVKFVKNTLEKGPAGLRTEFASMKRFNDFEKMKAFKGAQELGKNRYKDVGCLDNNRVKLNSPPWPHDYIHANYVATPTNPKRFICTQAPMDKTCADFWYMCLQEKVETIFMLCNLVEKGAKKCCEYFPYKDKSTMEFEEKGQKIIVKHESTQKIKFEKNSEAKVNETVFTVEGCGLTQKATHYHWIDWPDRGVPPADMAILELLAKARVSKAPIVVHCSAGIGRTGSVVMIEYIMDQLLAGQQIEESDKILQKIREQRNNSIQTDQQYLFVHQIMMNYFLDKKLFSTAVFLLFSSELILQKMNNLVDIDEDESQQKLSVNSTPYQTQECILYGSIFSKYIPDLERRLAGLCDPGSEDFFEHEMSFSLRSSGSTDVKTEIKLRRRFRTDVLIQNYWQLRYIGVPEPDQKCPTIVRKEISSLVHSQDMMTYAKSLGLRMDYEYISQGKLWTKGNIKILHSSLTRTIRPGTYDSSSLKSMSDSSLVEMSISLPESAEYMPAAKSLRDFADQFMPLVNMEKVDYWRKLFTTPIAPARR